jgi:hypothetical protein
MTRLFTRCVLGVLVMTVLAVAFSAYAQTTPSPQLPTNPNVDLLFTPVAPCRIIDTRVAGGPIAANATRNFAVSGTTGFAGQGGNAAGCGIPEGAPAAVINYVAVGPAGPGDLRVAAAGTSIPTASILNYSNIAGLNIANGVATPLATGTAPHIIIQADVSATDLVADVLGYYNEVSCQAGTTKLLGQCYETATHAAAALQAAADACKAAGGRLPNPLELNTLRGGPPNLALAAAPGEWTDMVVFNEAVTNLRGMTVDTGGNFAAFLVTDTYPYRCVFRPLP